MASIYKLLGDYIEPVELKNSDGALDEADLRGISVNKEFIDTHANLVGVTFEGYKVVPAQSFAYIPDTSRRGDRIAIAFNDSGNSLIVSSICTVFKVVKTDQLDSEYLNLWFNRSEFDRYARFKSHGSAREVFDWDQLCAVELPIPEIDIQQKIVSIKNCIDLRAKALAEQNDYLVELGDALFTQALKKSNQEITYRAIDTFCEVKGGKRLPKGAELISQANTHPYIRVRDLNNAVVLLLTPEMLYVDDDTQKSISRYIVNAGDVVVSVVGTIGLSAYIGKTLDGANLTENCNKLTSFDEGLAAWSYFFLRSAAGKEAIRLGTVGAVQAKLPLKNIKSIEVPFVPASEMEKATSTLNEILAMIQANMIESLSLVELRDALLPKLMSGEIDVSKIDLTQLNNHFA